jgi:methylase of polypeptide subunit release factors
MDTFIFWEEGGQNREALWRSENGIAAHKKVVIADDAMTADQAYRLACEGTALLWRGDFQNARQFLQALGRRVDKSSKKSQRAKKSDQNKAPLSSLDIFHRHRLAQSQRARILGMLLVECDADHCNHLRRAPDMSQACVEAYGSVAAPYLVSLRELLGVVSAYEWRKKGVMIQINDSEFAVHPHYGVFSPIRGEYIQLVNDAPLPKAIQHESLAFDIGVGTGILSAVLAKRGVKKILATDLDERALACAHENMLRLGLDLQVEITKAHLFPSGKAALIVCNPPWLPARPSSSLEGAIYDPDSQMLKGFLDSLALHLLPDGEGWLILSDLAEHLGLRTRKELLDWIDRAGLIVTDRIDTKPIHRKVYDVSDLLHAARASEVTSLWRLKAVVP